MELTVWKVALVLVLPLIMFAAQTVAAQSEDLGNGYMHHGVATPVSNHRGTVATVDGEGNNVVLVWLFDHRGGYGLLMVDAQTGESTTFETPFPPGGDTPYASILSSKNRYYTHFASHFCEFDPTVPGFTFEHATAPQMAMSMTEDDEGVIWSASYPSSGVVAYDPETKQFRDYGHVYTQNWRQYPRSIAADDQGWIYFGVGSTNAQIIILNRETGEATPVAPEEERGHGYGQVTRDVNGKVYGQIGEQWYELYGGQATKIDQPEINPKPIITGSQGLFHREFPNGDRLAYVDLVNRKLAVETADGETREVEFDYESEGAHIMGLASTSAGTIAGGTAFPMRFFSYDPRTDEWINRAAYGQWNTVAPAERLFYIGGYGGGFLLEWDPLAEWVPTEKDNPDSNPRFLTQVTPTIHRPHDLLVHPDGRWVILAGTPGYGYTGGGLLFWDREAEEQTVLTHEDLIPWQSAMSLAPLPDGNLLVGSTIAAGTGGEVRADLAELYIVDIDSMEMIWHEPLLDGAHGYTDMIAGPNGKIFGICDRTRFFVFDPESRSIVHEFDTSEQFGGSVSQQGTRAFVEDDEGNIYILFNRGIAQLDPETYEITMLSEAPLTIGGGGDYLDGRIYFYSGSHVYSWEVPTQ